MGRFSTSVRVYLSMMSRSPHDIYIHNIICMTFDLLDPQLVLGLKESGVVRMLGSERLPASLKGHTPTSGNMMELAAIVPRDSIYQRAVSWPHQLDHTPRSKEPP